MTVPSDPAQYSNVPPSPPGPPPTGGTSKFQLGIGAAAAAAIVGALIYGAIIKATDAQVGFVAIGLGALVGFAAAKVGGRHQLLPPIAAALALLGVLLGQLFGIYLAIKEAGVDIGVLEAWQEVVEPMDFLFFVLGALGAFQVARAVAD